MGEPGPEEQCPTHKAEHHQGNRTAATPDSNVGRGPFQ